MIRFVPSLGDNDANRANPNNWMEADGTTPHGAVPLSNEDAQMDEASTSGDMACNLLTGAGAMTGTGTVSCASGTSVSWGVTAGGSLMLTNSTVTSDPTIAMRGEGNTYDCDMAHTISFSVSGTFNAHTFAAGDCSGAITFVSGATITGGNYTTTLAIPTGVTVSGGSILTTGTCAADVSGGSVGGPTYTGNQSGGTVVLKGADVTYAPASWTGGTVNTTTFKSTITSSLTYTLGPASFTVFFPAVSLVTAAGFFGISQAMTGTLAVPASSDIRSGVGSGTLVVPAAAGVLSTVTFDNATVGTYVAPSRADVRFGTNVGTTTGTCVVPSRNDVRLSTNVDATTGLLVVPAAQYVDSTQTFDHDATSGTDVVPATNKVKSGEVYGPASGLTGTLASSGGSKFNVGGDVSF